MKMAKISIPGAEEWINQCEFFENRRGHHLAFRQQGTGPPIVMLHGFPTWSYDYAAVATDLAQDHQVITFDFLGYGASDKPNPYEYSVSESADSVQDLLSKLDICSMYLVAHDYGAIVAQELVDRQQAGKAQLNLTGITILNCGIVYSAYRPAFVQRILITPIIGKIFAGLVTSKTLRSGLANISGIRKLTDKEFDNLWHGVSMNNGHKISHLLIRYNAERNAHHARWEAALASWKGPLQLIWGLDDPVSGRHVLEPAIKMLPSAMVTKLQGVGHFPQIEEPEKVAKAIRSVLSLQSSPVARL